MERGKYQSPRFVYTMLYGVVLILAFIEVGSLFHPEVIYSGYDNVVKERILENCNDLHPHMNRGMLSWYMVCASDYIGNARLLPFAFAIALIPMTYLLISNVTRSRAVGLLSAAGLAINPVYLIFNDSAAYHQFWVFFMMCSMYSAYRFPLLVGPLFLMSVAAKTIALMFVPSMVVLFWGNKKAIISLAAAVLFTGVYTIAGGVELIQGAFIKEPELDYAAEQTYWIFTKHLGIWAIPMLAGGVLVPLFVREYRIALFVILAILSYYVIPAVTMQVTFPYHTIPIIMFATAGIALGIVRLRRKQSVKIQEMATY